VVTISAQAVSMTEGGPLYFSVRADPAPRTDLTVGVTISYGGCDQEPSSQSVTIAAGESSATLQVPTSGTAGCIVTATIADGGGYRVRSGADTSADTTVTRLPVPTAPLPEEPVVTIAADESSVVEGRDLSFTLTATPPPSSALTVTLSWSDPGSFLAPPVPQTVTIPTGGTVTLTAATHDNDHEPGGEVSVTILARSGYTFGAPDSATVAVTDNDASTTTSTPSAAPEVWPCPPAPVDPDERPYCPYVSVGTDASSVTEGTPASFTLTMDPTPLVATTVSMEWQYASTRVGDRPETVTFAVGSGTVTVTVQTIDNDVADGETFLYLTLTKIARSESNPYALKSTSVESVCIQDNDGS